MEGGKVKLVLLSDAGRAEEYFIIPTKSKRDLLIPAAEKGARKVWDGTKAVDLCRRPGITGIFAEVLGRAEGGRRHRPQRLSGRAPPRRRRPSPRWREATLPKRAPVLSRPPRGRRSRRPGRRTRLVGRRSTGRLAAVDRRARRLGRPWFQRVRIPSRLSARQCGRLPRGVVV